jgi:hypothetical protein
LQEPSIGFGKFLSIQTADQQDAQLELGTGKTF